jgi:hypothetical protein
LFVHFEHAPVALQKGADEDRQVSSPFVPRSPVHAAQVFVVVSQSGVSPLQGLESLMVQPTQVLVVVEQTGDDPLQSAFVLQASHLPALTPEVAQMFERQPADPASPGVHALPTGSPHSLSVVLHTPVTHARAPSAAVQVPPGTG